MDDSNVVSFPVPIRRMSPSEMAYDSWRVFRIVLTGEIQRSNERAAILGSILVGWSLILLVIAEVAA